MSFEIKPATRHAVPILMSLSGVSGSGKTYTALLIAAGIAGPNGKVGFLDTENGRGCMYSDSPGIKAALPPLAGSAYANYQTIELSAPFHPSRYIEAIDAFENAGYTVLVIDSASHAWSGEGGASDIAEKDKGRWNRAKLANKRFVTRLLYSSMSIVVCLRAQEKSKIIKLPNGKEETISLGIQPVSEKSFPFEFMLSFFMEEKTNLATQIKCPEPLLPLFPTPKLLTKEDGERIRQWNETGMLADLNEQIIKRSLLAAGEGMAAYQAFFGALNAAQKKALAGVHAQNKLAAEQADREAASTTVTEEDAQQGSAPADFIPPDTDLAAYRAAVGDTAYWRILGSNGSDSENPPKRGTAQFKTIMRELEDELKYQREAEGKAV